MSTSSFEKNDHLAGEDVKVDDIHGPRLGTSFDYDLRRGRSLLDQFADNVEMFDRSSRSMRVLTDHLLLIDMMKNPHILDVCDLGASLFGGSRLAYEWTGFMVGHLHPTPKISPAAPLAGTREPTATFSRLSEHSKLTLLASFAQLLANNILLIGFHVFTGARIIQTLDGGRHCTVIWSVVVTVLGIIASLPRSLNHVSSMSVFSAGCMGLSILLFLIFAGIEDHPLKGYGGVWPKKGVDVYTTAFPAEGVSWVDCLNAVLNITFLWVPQILFPTFISEMERPQDFPKALAGLAGMSFVLFIAVPVVGYHYLGQYAEAPSFGSLQTVYKKAGFAFVIVPTIVIGVIYCNVSAKFIYGRIMKDSKHRHSNTKIGWGVWGAVVSGIWIVAFIFGSVIPSMGDFLSLLGAAFDSFFGFIYWAIAYYALYKTELWKGPTRTLNTIIHIFLFICGLFLLGPGLYAAVMAIIADYAGGTRPAFSCATNAI
ncbi:hypothetical protein P7C70_g2099, partial [Phenoliferia sp. Uapishka_3]